MKTSPCHSVMLEGLHCQYAIVSSMRLTRSVVAKLMLNRSIPGLLANLALLCHDHCS